MKMKRSWFVVVLCGLMACGSTDHAGTSAGGTRHITQGGAQDIAHFRSIVARGEVPSPETLDEVGFFAEHAVDLPDADCGEDICLHSMLAVAPRFDGSNWTMAFVGMNTPIQPEELERPPLHIVVALEQSMYTRNVGAAYGVVRIARALRPEDQLSLVVFDDNARVLFQEISPQEEDRIQDTTQRLQTREQRGYPALYDGLVTAGNLAMSEFEGESRIVLLTSGRAEKGITSPARILSYAEALVQEGVSISVIGAGEAFDSRIPASLGELGAGTVAYAENNEDLQKIFDSEAELSLFPLATHFQLEVRAAPGYRVGRIYGARRAVAQSSYAGLSSPALFLGHRASTSHTGRRGGGGGLFVELFAEEGTEIPADAPAFTMSASWISSNGRSVGIERTVNNQLRPGQNPDGMWPSLSAPEHGNVFMMLNMYLALRASVSFYDSGDCARSLGVIDMMSPGIEGWQVEYDSPDIRADFELMMDVRDNVQSSCTAVPVQPTSFGGGCMNL